MPADVSGLVKKGEVGRIAHAYIIRYSADGKISGTLSSTHQLSTMIFSTFVYPFELTSFLILIAILGAMVLAHREKH